MQDILTKVATDIDLRALSDSTRRKYLRIIGVYLEFLGNEPVRESAESDMRRYSLSLKKRGLCETTIDTYLAAIFFLYEVALDWPINRKQVPLPKKAKSLPEILTRKQLAAIMDATANAKHRAIISLGFGSGLRVSEVAKLRVCDIDSESMRIFVKGGKGKKDRYTILSQTSLDCLRAYWRQYRPSHPDGWVFLGPYGYAHMTADACRSALNSSLLKADIDREHFSFHTLRHCFGTYLLEDGTDLMTIKEMMGHASIGTTALYLHLTNVTKGVISPIDTLSGIGA
ncbi:tyrosine-type recombinase/integrase [Gordonibacter sp.]|uniref:tyrosine-type recombinase/integrase n=1 Tax=Gordonibacter sp. TaxID=1968902 RepID=UPI002FC5ADE8